MRLLPISFCFSVLLLTACDDSNVARINSTEEPEYTTGIFESSSYFEHSCESPRSGTDPWTGRAYADRQGLTAHENFWLRSWSDETYLWYDEIVDQNPSGFDEPSAYFQTLKTNRITASGRNVDRFHFTYDSQVWFDLIQSGESVEYGAKFIQTRSSVPREIRIGFVEEDSPASRAGWSRGDYIVSVDGVNVAEQLTSADITTLNSGLRPDADETHIIEVMDSAGVVTAHTMEAEVVSAAAVLTSEVLQHEGSTVGYMVFNDHNAIAEQQLIDTVNQFKAADIDELVIDLRYNGGGYLWIASQLASMIVGDAGDGKVFESSVFNDKLVNRHPNSGNVVDPTPFFTQTLGFSVDSGADLPRLDLDRVVLLTSAGTCSASESIINGLLGIDFDVVLVGTSTCGKPYGFYARDNCGTTYFTVQSKGENAKGFAEFDDGFSPMNIPQNSGVLVNGCYIAEDFEHQLGDVRESKLSTALSYLTTGVCPAANTVEGASKVQQFDVHQPLSSDIQTLKIYKP